jgi:hypothetical protein
MDPGTTTPTDDRHPQKRKKKTFKREKKMKLIARP